MVVDRCTVTVDVDTTMFDIKMARMKEEIKEIQELTDRRPWWCPRWLRRAVNNG